MSDIRASGVCASAAADTIIAAMKTFPALGPRVLALVCVLALSILAFGAPRPFVPASSAIAAEATPTVDGTVVIEAQDHPRVSHPSGTQELRLAGTILDPAPLDPAFARDVNSAFMARQVYRGLMRFDESMQPVPELAQQVEISADGLTYTFHLRDNARFADGSPITADDVVSSLTRALDPATAVGVHAPLAGPSYLADIAGADAVIRGETHKLSGARAVDDSTVELRLAEPRSTFLMKLASAPGAVVDPKDVARGGEWWRNPNASGPFVVASWTPEEELRLAANPNYVGGEPDLKQVIFRLGPSANNPFNLYQADKIDVAQVPIDAIDYVSDPNSPLLPELDIAPMFSTEYIAFRDDVAPMDDPHIRRAIQLAFPRWKVADILLNGRMDSAHGMIPSGMLERDWSASAPAYDLQAAKAEIAKSKYGSADRVPPIRIYGAAPYASEALRDVLQSDLGLKVEVLQVFWPQFNEGLGHKTFPAYELQWVADYPDPETFLWSLFDSRSPDNYSAYDNADFDKLLDQAAKTLDTDERAALYDRAEGILLADDTVLPISHDVRYTLKKPWVHGLDFTPLGLLYLETAWIER
jgi:peptide/nickel transport system substrate-binding protein/oligopeptide transport system substrate-binding protein